MIGRTLRDALRSGLTSNELLPCCPLILRFSFIMLATASWSLALGDLFSLISDGVFLTTVEAGELFLCSESVYDISIILGLYLSPMIAFSYF